MAPDVLRVYASLSFDQFRFLQRTWHAYIMIVSSSPRLLYSATLGYRVAAEDQRTDSATLENLPAVEENRHRAIVSETHLHHRLKDTSLDFHAKGSHALDEVLVEIICLRGFCGVGV